MNQNDNTAKRLLLDANMGILEAQKQTFDELRAKGDTVGAMEQAQKMLGTAASTLDSAVDLLKDSTK